jgi:uncharacterized protein (TIGR02001 family)
MTNRLSIAALALLGAVSLSAQTPAPVEPAAPSYSVTVTGAAVSDYMWRGLRLSSGAFQPAVELAAGATTLGLWTSFPFDPKKVPDSSDPELDLYGSYTFTLNEATTVVPGFTAYIFPEAPTNLGFYRTTFEPSIAVNYTVNGLKLTPKLYYDFVTKGPTLELTAFYAVPLKEIGSEIDFTVQAGTYKWTDFANDTSPSIKAWGNYWMGNVSMPFQVTPKSKIVLGYTYTEGSGAYLKQGTFAKSVNTGAQSRGFGSISYSFTF